MVQAGKLPDETTMGSIGSTLRSNLSFSGTAKIEMRTDNKEQVFADELYYLLNRPTQNEVKATISIETQMSEEFQAEIKRQNDEIEAYNKSHTSVAQQKALLKSAIFPVTNVQLEGGNTMVVPVGKDISSSVKVMLSAQELSTDFIYELLITVEYINANGETKKQSLSYTIDVFQKPEDLADPWDPNLEVTLDTKFLTVFYLNTETYQPLLADIFIYQKMSNITYMTEESHSIGNIVNLRTVTADYNPASKRVSLTLSSDMRYVLEHASKYIRPLQERGRKVCLCIENGGKGIGFCNMGDAQIADFTQQVKDALAFYHLDGINLRDDGSKYGKEGMPVMNTTSYPKLIKALREALPSSMLTLEDKGEPTEYFYDVQKCGGIEVGKYIDYAWHGYASANEEIQFVDPWELDNPFSIYPRKPIAGLTPEHYGNVNIPLFPTRDDSSMKATDRTLMWKTEGRRKNNIIVFGNDLISNEQNSYEGATMVMLNFIDFVADDGTFWGPNPWPPFDLGMQSGDYFYSPNIAGKHEKIYNQGYKYLGKDW